MTDPAVFTPSPGVTEPPWTAHRHGLLLRRPAVELRANPGLRLPFGYHGHHENDRVPVTTVEHWFQACKATSRQQFDLILACSHGRDRQARRPARPSSAPTGSRSSST